MAVNDSAVGHRTAPNARGRVSRGPGRPSLTNEQLLHKALDLFLENGFERTTIDAITAAVVAEAVLVLEVAVGTCRCHRLRRCRLPHRGK